jgi:hypothetical protein
MLRPSDSLIRAVKIGGDANDRFEGDWLERYFKRPRERFADVGHIAKIEARQRIRKFTRRHGMVLSYVKMASP